METRTFDYKGIKTAYYYSEGGRDSIMLLHGYSFNSAVWSEMGLVEALNGLGLSVLAIDVPGFPQSANKLVMNEAEMVAFLGALSKTIEGKLFVLGTSASAHVVLKFAESGRDNLKGIVVVGPASVKGIALERIGAPVLAVWGSDDDVSPPYKSEDAIKSIKDSEISIIRNAGHACYLNQPKAFIRIVSDFIIRTR